MCASHHSLNVLAKCALQRHSPIDSKAKSHGFGEGNTFSPLTVLFALAAKFCNIKRSLVVVSLKCHFHFLERANLPPRYAPLLGSAFFFTLCLLFPACIFFPVPLFFYTCALLAISYSSSINKISLGGFCMKKTHCVVWKI